MGEEEKKKLRDIGKRGGVKKSNLCFDYGHTLHVCIMVTPL